MLDPSWVRATDQNYGVTAPLRRCLECGFISADPHAAQRITRLYTHAIDEEYLHSAEPRRLAFEKLMEQALLFGPLDTLLDIGAGVGILCEVAEALGASATGVEPSAWAVSRARERSLTMIEGYFPQAVPKELSVSVITAVDVIEHVSMPVEFLQTVRRHLRAGGLAIVVSPDVSSMAARAMGTRWWGLRPGHVGYFSPATMERAFARAGLRMVGHATFARYFPLGYLLERAAGQIHAGAFARWLNGRQALQKLLRLTVRFDLRDTRAYFGVPV